MSVQPTPACGHQVAGQFTVGWWVCGLTAEERAHILQDPETGAQPPAARPAWVDIVEQAVARARAPRHLPHLGSWQEAFAIPLSPFLGGVHDRLTECAKRCLWLTHADADRVADSYVAVLGEQLARTAVRVMVHELDKARKAGTLTGGSGQQRFAGFLTRLSTPPGLAALFQEFPVLARLLGTASLVAGDAGTELLTRLAADRAAVVETLLGNVDPGPVVAVKPGLGDRHCQGRSVALVSFADGRQVVYKPRSVAAHVVFGEVVQWLNQRIPAVGLRTVSAVSRPGYGWLEFIEPKPLPGPGAAARFYRREGALLAVLYALHATDMHSENLIACGDAPVLIDLETLFHPTLPTPRTNGADPAAQALSASAQRAAFLPSVIPGESGLSDFSAMGGGTTAKDVLDWDPPADERMRLIHRPVPQMAAANRPIVDGEPLEPADHEAAILAGFRLGYDAIAREREAFARLIESRGDLEVRTVVRPTRGYVRLIDESTHPDLMRDACDREMAFEVLRTASAGQPLWARLARHELHDLWAGDVPLLTSRPSSTDIWTSAGLRLAGLLDRPGLACALDKVTTMGDVDRRDQEWVISASLAARRPVCGHRSTRPAPGPVTATTADPGRLLAAACGIADQIMARAMAGGDGQCRVNWLGLQLVDNLQWMVLPMGAGLADGYLGVALFLAQLAELTRVNRYEDMARRAVSALPALLDSLDGRPEILTAIGCGGADGLGGISYGLARMSSLLHDAELGHWAGAAAALAATAHDLCDQPGWAAGSAGCLAAMASVYAETGSGAAAALARACADRLRTLVEETDGWCVPDGDPVPAGFADGPAGIGWALARFAAGPSEPQYHGAARRAVRRVEELAREAPGPGSYGWCSGTAGLVLALTCLSRGAGDDGPQVGVGHLADRPVLADLSLCHGELGITEVLTILATHSKGKVAYQSQRHRTGLILDTVNRHVPYCGTPGGVPTPGLMNGLAGIGYGLLRLGFADRVPSVLLLEPAPQLAPHDRPAGSGLGEPAITTANTAHAARRTQCHTQEPALRSP
ncbi:MAG TPA: type 2 lanthipeptide synthetase LanM family protein [Streptosporangiaceae bacterium]|nr:type 2 lanthipeptide synthetase LanM family protein [Streptosporangiaceae bacterium]